MTQDDPSLLSFVLERLDEEEGFILLNTPMPAERELDPEFVERLVGRSALIERTRLDRDLVTLCVESMRRVQGPPPVPVPEGPADEATVLGSQVVKHIAARFAWHPAYNDAWLPD